MPSSTQRRTFIIGAGCTAFIKPRATRTPEDVSETGILRGVALKDLVDGSRGCDESATRGWYHVRRGSGCVCWLRAIACSRQEALLLTVPLSSVTAIQQLDNEHCTTLV